MKCDSRPKPLDFPTEPCHTMSIPKETHMETLDTATLALLAQLEEDLGCPIEVTDWDDDLTLLADLEALEA